MTRIFGSPSTYVQGAGSLFQSASYIQSLGNHALLLADQIVFDLVGKQYCDYLTKEGLTVQPVIFNGEASDNEIARVGALGKQAQTQVIIGLGGGKTLDSAKAIANDLKIAVAILPTLASTDAPCSRLSVLYTDDGAFAKYRFYDQNPNLVLVDTKVVADAPARLFASGIADALATNIEAQAVAKGSNDTMLGAKQTAVGIAIAEECEATLFEYGIEAYASVQNHVASKAVENVVEANTLMSGLGFESGGLAAAHAIHNGLTALTGDIHHMTHGEKVAFGTLTQLFLEGADQARFEKYLKFDLELGLPTTFADLHIDGISDADLLKVGTLATASEDTMQQMPFEVTPEDVVQAMKGVDTYSRYYQRKH